MDRVDQPGRRPGRADQGDDIVLAQQPVDALAAGEAQRGRARGPIGLVEPGGRLGLLEQLLAEQRHLLVAHGRG